MRAIGNSADPKGTASSDEGAAGNTSHAAETSGEFALSDSDIVTETPEDDSVMDEAEAGPKHGWLAPVLAAAFALGWTGFYLWAMRAAIYAAPASAPSEWARLITDWAMPMALIGIVWVIAMRNSHAEATRFGTAAAMLRRESEQLERRLTAVNRELSLAREFLASQSRELETLGRLASERIAAHAGELQALIMHNGAQVDRIGSASETALANMASLRDDLPVIANSARDVTNQIGNAGRTAQERLDSLVAGFEQLSEFGRASETQIAALGSSVAEMLGGFETRLDQIAQLAEQRFDELRQGADSYGSEVSDRERAALAAMNVRVAALRSETRAVSEQLEQAERDTAARISASIQRLQAELHQMIQTIDGLDQSAVATARQRIKELHEEASRFDAILAQRDAKFLEEMERRQAEFETRETQAAELLSQRLAELDETLAERRETQIAETARLVEHSQAMNSELETFNALLARIGESSETTRANLSQGIGALEGQLAAKRAALIETESQLASITNASIRLLEIIQSGAKQSREDLPQAIDSAAAALSSVEERAQELSGFMLRTSQHGGELSEYLVRTREEIAQADTQISALHAKLEQQADDALAKLQGLRTRLDQLASEGQSFAADTQTQLLDAIARLETAIEASFAALDTGARERITTLADTLSDQAVQALERGLRNEAAESIGALEQAAAHASGVGRESAIQLRDQLAKVNELTGNLEARIARARELAAEQVNNDFARRMALISDSLNSNAIDIAGALATEVTDTAWDAYLKGDRGIFTRRAVRLIDNGQARDIAELYQNDEAFKVNVARYIHDFEAMLRSMLSTRDGKALSVTVLGSDMGKLYVLLAQAIERFRA
jgi:DNA repair exonuclease SbcCD ATPase subunit